MTKVTGNEMSRNPRMKDLGWYGGETGKGKKLRSHVTRFGKINHYNYSINNGGRGVRAAVRSP